MLKSAEPFNASGGASRMGDKMLRGEEVIALRRHNMSAEYQMTDLGGYDVLRWNGGCATIHDREYTARPPGPIGHARVEWRELGSPMQQKLEANPQITEVYEARRKECKGVTIGRVSAACVDYDRKLGDEIVRYVRNGGKLASPAKAP
jgi:hypothetical protein